MADYDDLRKAFDENSYLRQIASQAVKNKWVSGITLSVHPLWRLAYDFYASGVNPTFSRIWSEDLIRDVFLDNLSSTYYNNHFYRLLDRYLNVYQGYVNRDLNMIHLPIWERFVERYRPWSNNYYSPLVMTIVHKPRKSPKRGEKVVENEPSDSLEDLYRLVRDSSWNVRIEERPRARLAASSGDEIETSSGKFGTIGGVLTDSASGNMYGLTCAHVAKKKETVSDSFGNLIGTCIENSNLVSLSLNNTCDPSIHAIPNPYPGNGPVVNMLDCSLIQLSSNFTKPYIASTAQRLSLGQNVVLNGAKSNIKCKLGSLQLSYSYYGLQTEYCFRDSIELLPQPVGPLGGTLGQLFTTIPKQGDSGAWVLTDDADPLWAGMFYGEDGTRGALIRANWVHDWAENKLGGISLQV